MFDEDKLDARGSERAFMCEMRLATLGGIVSYEPGFPVVAIVVKFTYLLRDTFNCVLYLRLFQQGASKLIPLL